MKLRKSGFDQFGFWETRALKSLKSNCVLCHIIIKKFPFEEKWILNILSTQIRKRVVYLSICYLNQKSRDIDSVPIDSVIP